VLFGKPLAIYADLGVQKDGGQADDYFHLLLRYPRLRVLLHASQMTADQPAHGRARDQGSFVKQGLDPQEAQLKAGMTPGAQAGAATAATAC
jgi:hypothetical protein